MVEDLLRGFVRARWGTELDFSSLEKIGTPGISENLRRRESDAIWRIPWRRGEHSGFVYLLIEFQSSPDRFMALRMQTYVALVHQDLVRRKQLTPDGKLPAVLPVVLYNGERRWNSSAEMAKLMARMPPQLLRYAPQSAYMLIDELAMPERKLPGAGNLVGTLIRLERNRGKSDVLPLAAQLERELRAPELKELRRQFATWIHEVWPSSRFPGMAMPPITDLEEVWSMLEQRFPQWAEEFKEEGCRKGRREGRKEGRQEGRQEGQAAIVRRLMTRRFGHLPRDVIARIEKARPQQLGRWSERLLDATTLHDVFRRN